MQDNSFIEVAVKAAAAAGAVLADYYNDSTIMVSKKESARDIVAQADTAAEKVIVEILQSHDSSIAIISEESGQIGGKSQDKFWLVDPLDGTVNYVNRIPFFAVSIAYIERGVLSVGAIYAPIVDDIYYGSRLIGAYKNHQKIRVADSQYGDGLFAASFSGKNYEPAKRKDEFALFAEVNDSSRGCLRTGSAALNLAYLAEGRFNGCFGKANKYWDIASGLLLAELAGAKVEIKHLDQVKNLTSYLACSGIIWNDLKKQVKNVLKLQ